jgi:exoribonuclease-2
LNRVSKDDRQNLFAIARRAMIERGMEPEFSPAVQRELAGIAGPATAVPGARDLRGLLWASIDNDDSRDLDQLTVAERRQDGRIRVLVAIADVDALVAERSAIDGHASHNTTSVYTPAAIFPMLPTVLSTNLTSLNQDEDRFAVVVDMEFDSGGALAGSDLYRAQVRNRAKLAYPSVAAWLDGAAPAPSPLAQVPGLDDNLRIQDELAQKLAEQRHRSTEMPWPTSSAIPRTGRSKSSRIS